MRLWFEQYFLANPAQCYPEMTTGLILKEGRTHEMVSNLRIATDNVSIDIHNTTTTNYIYIYNINITLIFSKWIQT